MSVMQKQEDWYVVYDDKRMNLGHQTAHRIKILHYFYNGQPLCRLIQFDSFRSHLVKADYKKKCAHCLKIRNTYKDLSNMFVEKKV